MDRSPLPTNYRIFLLTVWRNGSAGEKDVTELRFSIDDPRSGQRRALGRLNELVAFLERSLDEAEDSNSEQRKPYT
jgi:hypothetical protein